VDRQEDNSCSSQIAVPQLGILKDLKAFGTTDVDLPPTKGGTYTLTCGMGMMSGQLVVSGAGGGSASAGTPTGAITSAVSGLGLLPMLGVVALLGLGATWYVRRRRQPAAAKADEPNARTAKARTANAGASKSKASKSRDTHHAEPAGFLGFNKNELITIAAAIAVAILAGFTIGGGLR
jgi:hypothetical protein